MNTIGECAVCACPLAVEDDESPQDWLDARRDVRGMRVRGGSEGSGPLTVDLLVKMNRAQDEFFERGGSVDAFDFLTCYQSIATREAR